jgi:hypothetical protein
MRWCAARSTTSTSQRIFDGAAQLLNVDLSAFYFDIRKDALYCDADRLAPITCFTAEEAGRRAEICITSGGDLVAGEAPAGAFTLPDVPGVAVVPSPAEGTKCARCWQVLEEVGKSPPIR